MRKARSMGIVAGGVALVYGMATAYAVDSPKPADAGGKGGNVAAKKGKTSENDAGLEEFAMAQQLVRYGVSHSDPLFLISAAKIMKQNPPQVEARSKKTEGGDGADDEKGKSAQDLSNPENVLAKAKEMAAGKPEMIAMVDSVAAYTAPKSRGRIGGPAKHHDRVRARQIDTFVLAFEGDEQARIAVIGDGDSDLDCVVVDENGNTVSKDEDAGDTCTLSWTPAWTGKFGIGIANLGKVSNRYVLLTN